MANLVLYLWISEARETRSWSAGGFSFNIEKLIRIVFVVKRAENDQL